MRTETGFKFKVFRKPTNKEDCVHFYSAHSERVKSGIVIGFFLRAFRICDEAYLPDEIEHICKTFRSTHRDLLLNRRRREKDEKKRKTEKIMKKKRAPAKKGEKKYDRWITIPYSRQAEAISKKLESIGVRVATNSGKTIKNLTRLKGETKIDSEKSVVYEIPFGGCLKTYVGGTGRGIKTRLSEHKSDVKFHRTSNAIVLHIDECRNLPKWEDTRNLEKTMKKRNRKILEAAHILSRNTFNTRSGFITWAGTVAKLAVGGN